MFLYVVNEGSRLDNVKMNIRRSWGTSDPFFPVVYNIVHSLKKKTFFFFSLPVFLPLWKGNQSHWILSQERNAVMCAWPHKHTTLRSILRVSQLNRCHLLVKDHLLNTELSIRILRKMPSLVKLFFTCVKLRVHYGPESSSEDRSREASSRSASALCRTLISMHLSIYVLEMTS